MSKDRKRTPEQVIADYRAAYLAANGRSIPVKYNRGWYVINAAPYQSRHRGVQVEQFIAELRNRVSRTPTQALKETKR